MSQFIRLVGGLCFTSEHVVYLKKKKLEKKEEERNSVVIMHFLGRIFGKKKCNYAKPKLLKTLTDSRDHTLICIYEIDASQKEPPS